LTPVFNGAAYIRDAIQSVLRQTHTNWDYVIVNNCSTDETLAIAKDYARKDRRIRVYSNDRFVNVDENHNIAFRYVGEDADYVKVVAADDWIGDDCVQRMVALAEANPTVGIVGAYQGRGAEVLWTGIPPGVSVLSGRDAARLGLLHGIHILGVPTSVLYRAKLVRSRRDFFPHTRPHADTDACYEVFSRYDLGFLHEILSFDRIRAGQESSRVKSVQGHDLYYLETVMRYGKTFLDPAEYERRLAEIEATYYRTLGRAVLTFRGPAFWRFHVGEARAIGLALSWKRVAQSVASDALGMVKRPGRIARKIRTKASALRNE
jgi:glycosyltransferase involved in cell wall biosynthesis